MNEKKNIDRLFQEKLKDFEAAPPEFVWDNIQEALQQGNKKTHAVRPLWYRLSSIAALLAIGLVLVTPYFEDNSTKDVPVVTNAPNNGTEDGLRANPATGTGVPGKTVSPTPRTTPGPNTVVASEDNASQNTAAPSSANSAYTNGSNGSSQDAAGRKTSRTAGSIRDNGTAVAHSNHGNDAKSANALGQDNRSHGNGRQKGNVPQARNASGHSVQAVAQGNREQSGNRGNSSPAATGTTKTLLPDTAGKPGSEAGNTPYSSRGIAATQSQDGTGRNSNATGNANTGQTNDSRITAADVRGNNSYDSNNGNGKNGTGQAGTADTATPQGITLSATEIAATSVDTTGVKPLNELEALQQKLEEEKEKEKALAQSGAGKWNIRPQIAPVFYNSLSEGSPINTDFAANNKSYDNDLSLGLSVNYAITDRLTIRSAVNRVNLSYSTNDITFHASMNQATVNVESARTSANIVVESMAMPVDPNPDEVSFIIDQKPTQTFNGSMIQRTGYIEVPLEMSYALLNKKFGINIIGGMSTLFLNENNVSVVSQQGYSADVGKAKNLNDIHFSTNVGVGFRYRFWKAFEANFEPMFKYQMNAYSRDAGNFRPYFIGLYSGISFSF